MHTYNVQTCIVIYVRVQKQRCCFYVQMVGYLRMDIGAPTVWYTLEGRPGQATEESRLVVAIQLLAARAPSSLKAVRF